MRACLQRVTRARVVLPDEGNRVSGQIENGFLVLLGVGQDDTSDEVRLLARKICRLRVFDDPQGKMNLDIAQVGGAILAVSQFTLYADAVHGNRPGFTDAAPPDRAKRLYEEFVSLVRAEYGIPVETGVFQAMMSVELVNDGPVTVWLDTDELSKKKASR
ncbi:MAG: D-tyrosyl-tRNA(Tyr) deacylase [Thermoguttaceae bacterium]|nr:D-tyrosyl-tRNA(Tyr) deacylase [Thermoguttaceae bacterium]MBR6481290.1 D-tyrosyl-tRNA(Tyr) deacylase [Thermoguttaceae bacterium]MCR5359412.1 D-tyrosyl-tRNA(Tyr) deacylase [Thermoguttaceae bacterium]